MRVDNIFYLGEHGFYFNLKTGIDMTGVVDGDVRAVWLRPDGTHVSPSVPTGDRIDPATGDVNVTVPQGLLSAAGTYILQIVVRVGGGVVASRPIQFAAQQGAAPDLSGVFA